jgi:hypothetical protein
MNVTNVSFRVGTFRWRKTSKIRSTRLSKGSPVVGSRPRARNRSSSDSCTRASSMRVSIPAMSTWRFTRTAAAMAAARTATYQKRMRPRMPQKTFRELALRSSVIGVVPAIVVVVIVVVVVPGGGRGRGGRGLGTIPRSGVRPGVATHFRIRASRVLAGTRDRAVPVELDHDRRHASRLRRTAELDEGPPRSGCRGQAHRHDRDASWSHHTRMSSDRGLRMKGA